MIFKIKLWIYLKLRKNMGMVDGPYMLRKGGADWVFVDPYGQIYSVRYTGQYEIPLSISKIER